MIQVEDALFSLSTKRTSYVFRVMPTGHLEHLYYGRKIHACLDGLVEQHEFAPGNTNIYDSDHPQFSLEDVCLEMSSYGKGDIREPFIELELQDGSYTSDFVYEKYEQGTGKKEFETLPGSYDEKGEVEFLRIFLRDQNSGVLLEITYYVYFDCDVITRSAKLINESTNAIKLHRLMSLQLDLEPSDYVLTTFHGAWAREMEKQDVKLVPGKVVNASYTGTSSSRVNPFAMISKADTNECYGFNLIYSGNHYEASEINSFGKLRFVSGINPQSFCFTLEPDSFFEAPEAIMTYSYDGPNFMSQNMHQFIREHIVRGPWKYKERPILLNSWEANYFDINERQLVNLALKAKEVGIELFVMDDGWFSNRKDDTSSLGDWYPNTKKLPGGLKRIADKINRIGLNFGLWVEPEMVNVDSDLYRKHPEWVIEIPGKNHSEGRNQRILDLCQEEVQDSIIEEMTRVFSSANISYVKWDMNRTFTDYYSKYLDSNSQMEVAHRYVLGLYRCMKELTTRFPNILFEGCAAGGNRFDLGILCYFPQIWASDNTDALCRTQIQDGYSYGYPLSVFSAHVSNCPNHQTLRNTPLETRFAVASFGLLGYECNFCDMKKEGLEKIKEQISLYKKWRDVFQLGTFYRSRNDNIVEWTCVSKDQTKAVGMIMQKNVKPNTQYEYYKPMGLLEDQKYHFYNRELKFSVKELGDLVNTVSPIHIKQDSFTHYVLSKFVKMDQEKENLIAYGDTLMYAGVKLKPAFAANGYNENVRHFPDFASRLYFMEVLE